MQMCPQRVETMKETEAEKRLPQKRDPLFVIMLSMFCD